MTATIDNPTTRVARVITSSSREDIFRWRSTPNSILKGEARAILETNDSFPTDSKIELLAEFMVLFSNNPEAFNMRKPSRLRSGLGEALFQKVERLSQPKLKAGTHIKIWHSSTGIEFAKLHLPAIIRIGSKSNFPIVFSAPNVLESLFLWDQYKDRVIESISAECFIPTPKKKTSTQTA